MHRSTFGRKSTFESVTLSLLLVMLWLVLHGYHGITGDGQIYALQAMARLHPNLTADLYLQNTSQDQFTLFSPGYAWCIALMGLEGAARTVTLLSTLWLLIAVWAFARVAAGRYGAWAAVALLLISAGNYGGSGVFRILEPFLTARLPAQALIATALFLQFLGMPRVSLTLGLGTLLIHPLMALPGLLLVVCVQRPIRLGLIGGSLGVLATLLVAIGAATIPELSHVLTVMDDQWLEVVRERSQFLFLQLWTVDDWETNARPLVCLGFMAIALPDPRLRKLCQAAALIGGAGLCVALIGGLIGPVAILVQGQTWRWVWISVLVTVVLLPCALWHAARTDKCGVLCALLLLLGWTLPGIAGPASGALASLLWVLRSPLNARAGRWLRWGPAAIGIFVGAWLLTRCRAIVASSGSPTAASPPGVPQIREILALEIPAVMLYAVMAWPLRVARTRWLPLILSALLAAISSVVFFAAFNQSRFLAASSEVQKFATWSARIPPRSTVLVAPPRDVGAFVWFTLDRPNYLSLDQSAGVVFSRATALEVRRRSEVLLPLMDADWKIRTRLRSHPPKGGGTGEAGRPLTTNSLIQVCADPELGFVISPESVEFDRVPHIEAGPFKDWNLYDCSEVRTAANSAAKSS